MDYAVLPPEVNSGRIYAGPGAGPMMAAAAAWAGLAAELESAADSYQSVISGLTDEPWLGPSSVAMAAAAAPYVGWMSATAAQAAQTATQAHATAAAYETAFAATVPPAVIAANRALLMALVASNIFGQNTPAIAATETHYTEMWAQDAAAMYGYAGATAMVTSALPTFSPAPQTTTGSAPAAQLTSAALQGLASTASTGSAVAAPPLFPVDVLSTLSGLAGLAIFGPSAGAAGLTPVDLIADFSDFGADSQDLGVDEFVEGEVEEEVGEGAAPAAAGIVPFAPPGAVGTSLTWPETPLGPAGVPALSAGLGRAASIGGLSVPTSWATAAPAIRATALELPSAGLGAVPEVWTGSSGNVFSEMALASMAGRAIGGTASLGTRAVSKKLGDSTDYRTGIAATFGGVVAPANKGYRAGFTDTAHGEGELLKQVAEQYPGVFALLNALCSPNAPSTEATLAKLEREIRSFARSFPGAD